jgi:hypothetical protein
MNGISSCLSIVISAVGCRRAVSFGICRQNQLRQKPCEGAETDSRANFGKETMTGAYRRPKWAPYYSA